jgi:hypothetical protein
VFDTSKAEMIHKLLLIRALFRYPVFKVQVHPASSAGLTYYHVSGRLLNPQRLVIVETRWLKDCSFKTELERKKRIATLPRQLWTFIALAGSLERR